MSRMNLTSGRALVAAFKESDLRVREFCAVQGVSYAVLKYWRSRVAAVDGELSQHGHFVQVHTRGTTSSFCEAAEKVSAVDVEVVLPNQVRLTFRDGAQLSDAHIWALAQC